jgi:CopG family nickel-responsive transcriptional regulator
MESSLQSFWQYMMKNPDAQVTEMRHDYDKLITTHILNKIDRDHCLGIFLLKGEAVEIKDMTKKFQSNKKMDNVKLIAM